jgi:adenine-specific DNA-methyltransferase
MEEQFVNQTMMTMIGNKRKLVNNIYDIVLDLKKSLNTDKLTILDAFAGSCVVSRSFSSLCETIYSNDLELYSYKMAKCFLEKPTNEETIEKIKTHIDKMNEIALNGPYYEGIITKLYAPKNDDDIQDGERVFYTHQNALIIDTLRKYIDDFVEPELFDYCITPLIIKASIHNNTSGVFKGFHKKNGKGCFGGAGENALSRILKPITLEMPIWTNYNFNSYCFNRDINELINELPNDIDIIYLDPPYNQHPYGSNYFMMNLIITNTEPEKISKVSGIPANWNKSNYNYKDKAGLNIKNLIDIGLQKSKYIVISYNNEGIITDKEFEKIFENYNVVKHEIKYDTYKGCKNLKNRNNKVIEIIYVVSLF